MSGTSRGAEPGHGGIAGGVRGATILVVSIVVTVAALLFVRNALGAAHPWLNHDVALLNLLGNGLLGGDRLYVDVLEMNPPGSHYLHAGIIGVGRLLGVSPFLATHVFVLLVGVAGLRVLTASGRQRDGGWTFALVLLAYALVLVRGNFSNNVSPSAPFMETAAASKIGVDARNGTC